MTSSSHIIKISPQLSISQGDEGLTYTVPTDIDCITGIYFTSRPDMSFSDIKTITAFIEYQDRERGTLTSVTEISGDQFRSFNARRNTRIPLYTDTKGVPGSFPTFLMSSFRLVVVYDKVCMGDPTIVCACKSFKNQQQCRDLVRQQGFILRHHSGKECVTVVRLA